MLLANRRKDKPFVTFCNVICNQNYKEVEDMYKFALQVKADSVYFTLIDTVEGTEVLLLNGEQKQDVLRQTEAIKKGWENLSENNRIQLDYFEGFTGRLKGENFLKGDYDMQRVNQVPCYTGWIFTRILADGNVAPCCRGVNKIMGNINTKDFCKIWLSDKYNEFRAKARYLDKTDPYFWEIGCMKMCDNLMHNEKTDRIFEEALKICK
jgi:MoaA/NifB/PqqE/SkfB family radical SAM enzyme